MIQIRYGIFESNSSSTHSLCVATDKEYADLLRGEMFIDMWREKLVTKDFVIKQIVRKIEESPIMVEYMVPILLGADLELPAHWTEEFFSFLPTELLNAITIELEFGYRSFDYFMEESFLDFYDETYTTPGGETIHIFGNYGTDH